MAVADRRGRGTGSGSDGVGACGAVARIVAPACPRPIRAAAVPPARIDVDDPSARPCPSPPTVPCRRRRACVPAAGAGDAAPRDAPAPPRRGRSARRFPRRRARCWPRWRARGRRGGRRVARRPAHAAGAAHPGRAAAGRASRRRAQAPARRRRRLATELRDAQAKIALLEARLAESQAQQAALEALYRDLAPSRDEIALTEIEQVLLVASQQLQLAGNVQSALAALQLADAQAAAPRAAAIPAAAAGAHARHRSAEGDAVRRRRRA